MTSLSLFLRACYFLSLLRPVSPSVVGFAISSDGYFLSVIMVYFIHIYLLQNVKVEPLFITICILTFWCSRTMETVTMNLRGETCCMKLGMQQFGKVWTNKHLSATDLLDETYTCDLGTF